MKKLIFATLMLLSACSSKIQHGLSERDANEIKAVLEDHGISTSLATEGKDAKWTVEVSQGQASEAIRVLRDNNLPRQETPGFSEIFGQGSMVPTATEERAKMIQALSGENARMLEGIEGVVRAKVIVVPESKSSAFGQAEPARASVFLKVSSQRSDAVNARKAELQQLVAGSVPGLTPDHVAVLVDVVNTQPRPVIVEQKDRTAAMAVGIVAAVLIALLAAALVWSTLRTRKLRLQLAEHAPEDSEAESDDEPAPAPTKKAA